MEKIINMIKGVVIGIATLVPGVSGGTMAIILGIYDQIIHAISSFFKDIKKNTIFLLTVGLGGIIGLAGFSKIINYALEHFEYPMIYLFLGIIIGGIPVLYKKADVGDKKPKDWIYFAIGFIIIVIMTIYDGAIMTQVNSTGLVNFIFLLIAGIVIAVALILPGISTSFMLLALGLYDMTLQAIDKVEVAFLVPMVLGIGLGIITTTRILENLMNNKPRQTYMVILGFVLGSMIEVFPGIPAGLDILVSIITFIIGFILIRYMSKRFGE